MKRDPMAGITGNETMIGTGVRVKGNLSSEHDIVIDGTLTGNVKTKGAITVGVNAHVSGNLTARDVGVAGQLHGDVKAANQTTIAETGRVIGSITTTHLTIAHGGIFVGASTMPLPETASETIEPTITPVEELPDSPGNS